MQRQCVATALPLPSAMTRRNLRAFLSLQRSRVTTFAPRCSPPPHAHRLSFMYRPVRFKDGTPVRTGLAANGQRRHESSLGNVTEEQLDKQTRTPWHREGSDSPPVMRQRSDEAMAQGKLLTTPSRLLKLIVPLTASGNDDDPGRKGIEPLALLVHPQQPLSYLERLIQSELPPVKNAKGEEKAPAVYFKAEEIQQDAIEPKAKHERRDDTEEDMYEGALEEGQMEETSLDGTREKTGKVGTKAQALEDVAPRDEVAGGHGADGPETKETNKSKVFVRWSTSTDIGDFIRDAARGKEFEIEVEGIPDPIRIAVPSFNDRTHYLRLRLRKTASKIIDLAAIKKECDMAAHKGAQRVAIAGAGVLIGYWYVVYRLTFETELGWDTMEPVTYLVGLSTLICGYLWFLYHNREVSYRSAMNVTISRRQDKLYQMKGFDHNKWESLIEEANGYRKEIKQIASEYDVEWDETEDERDERVTEAMKKVRKDRKNERKDKKDDDEDD